MDNQHQLKMGTEKISKLIISMSLPAMFSMLIQALYNIVDSMFVAYYSEGALSAVSLAFPVQFLLISISVGTGVGINSLMSRRLGEKKTDDARKSGINGLFVAFLSGIVTIIASIFLTKPFYSLFATGAQTYEMACQYSYIVTFCSLFIYISVAIEKIFQGTGNMIIPMIQNILGAVVNIILDPILIFGLFGFPELGIRGAALATVIGIFCSMIFGIYMLFVKKNVLNLSFKGFKPDKHVIKEIYKVGMPSIVMQAVTSVLVAGMNVILSGFSEIAVVVMGVYFKLQSFVFMPVFGLMQGYLPVFAYNFGAKNLVRIKESYKITAIAALAIMSLGVLTFNVFSEDLMLIFRPSQELMLQGSQALRIISYSFPAAAIGILSSATFQAVGWGMTCLLISILRQLILILPLAYLLATYLGVNAAWYSFVIADYITFLFSIGMIYHLYKTSLIYLPYQKESEGKN